MSNMKRFKEDVMECPDCKKDWPYEDQKLELA